MEHSRDELQINLPEIFAYLKKKAVIILLVTVIAGFAGLLFNLLFTTPQYTASTRVYILNRQNDEVIYYADLQSSSQFINDYTVLITGQNVTKTVVEKLSLQESHSKLSSRISVSAPADTRILEIKVSHEDPKLAADIANAVREEATQQIEAIMDGNAVNLVYEADVPTTPSSMSSGKTAVLAAAVGLICTVAVLSLVFVMDDTIRTEEDVERHLSLSVLGVIPMSTELAATSGAADKEMKKRLIDGKL